MWVDYSTILDNVNCEAEINKRKIIFWGKTVKICENFKNICLFIIHDIVPLHPYRTKSQDYSKEEECRAPSKIGPFPYCYRTSLSKVFGLNRQNLWQKSRKIGKWLLYFIG